MEDFFTNTDGSSDPNTDGSSDPNTPIGTAISTISPEFRCPEQNNTLFQQLQENYNSLLTKYADLENTIDRLRVEKMVNSDSPKASHMVHSGLSRNTSNLMNLDCSHAQRAEVCSTGQERPDACPSRLKQQVFKILFNRFEKFHQQLQTFEDLLQSDKLTSLDKRTGLSQLSEGLNSLKREFFLARDEHRLLQQRGEETCRFDSERCRELEGLVFQCGQRMDELKENVKHAPVAGIPSSDPSEGEKSQTHPQSCIRQNKQTRAENGPTDPWIMSDLYSSTSNAQSATEEQQSRPFIESPCSSVSPPAACRRHVDPQRAPDSRQGANHKEAFMTLQTKEDRLKEILDISLRTEKFLSTLTAAASAQRSCSPLHTPSPSIRERWSDVSLGRRSGQAVSEIEPESVCRATRASSAALEQQQSHVLRRSFLEQPQPQVSRCTQTSVAAHSFSPLNVRSRNTQTWSSSSPDEADEPDSKDQSCFCPQCTSFHRISDKRPLGGSKEPSDRPCCCHAIYGRLKLHGCTDSDCCRRCPSTHFQHRPAESPDSASTRRYTAVAVSHSALQFVPLYPQQLLDTGFWVLVRCSSDGQNASNAHPDTWLFNDVRSPLPQAAHSVLHLLDSRGP